MKGSYQSWLGRNLLISDCSDPRVAYTVVSDLLSLVNAKFDEWEEPTQGANYYY